MATPEMPSPWGPHAEIALRTAAIHALSETDNDSHNPLLSPASLVDILFVVHGARALPALMLLVEDVQPQLSPRLKDAQLLYDQLMDTEYHPAQAALFARALNITLSQTANPQIITKIKERLEQPGHEPADVGVKMLCMLALEGISDSGVLEAIASLTRFPASREPDDTDRVIIDSAMAALAGMVSPRDEALKPAARTILDMIALDESVHSVVRQSASRLFNATRITPGHYTAFYLRRFEAAVHHLPERQAVIQPPTPPDKQSAKATHHAHRLIDIHGQPAYRCAAQLVSTFGGPLSDHGNYLLGELKTDERPFLHRAIDAVRLAGHHAIGTPLVDLLSRGKLDQKVLAAIALSNPDATTQRTALDRISDRNAGPATRKLAAYVFGTATINAYASAIDSAINNAEPPMREALANYFRIGSRDRNGELLVATFTSQSGIP